ncbi:hypothetical protein BKA80DRAFT_311526 [Phyllosticta citrichinensis]
MGLFKRKNKGSGAQKPLVISAPTDFVHVGGHSTMALTARPIVGAETDATLAAPGEGSSLAPKPDSRAAEVSTMDLTALPVVAPPPARKGLVKKFLSVFRGRKAKDETVAPAAATTTTTTTTTGAISPAAAAASAASSSSESAPASRPATPLCVSPVRPSAPVAPRIPALPFAGPVSPRAQALAALSVSRSAEEPTNVVASVEMKREWRETSVMDLLDQDRGLVFMTPKRD